MKSQILDQFRSSAETAIRTGEMLSADIERCASSLIATLDAGGKILVCGNGGSAADAMHFSAELLVRFESERQGLAAIALSADTAAITAAGNDYRFRHIFSRQIEALARPGDHLMVITTSGNSENLIEAVAAAKQVGGVVITALSGRDGGRLSTLLESDDIELRVPSITTARIQEAHAIIIHALCSLIDRHFQKDP
jgi:phosphoheptose isomerase